MDSGHNICQVLEVRTLFQHLSEASLIHHLLTSRIHYYSSLRHGIHQLEIDRTLRLGRSRNMQRDDLASLKQIGCRNYSLHTIGLNHGSRTERIVSVNLHTEAFSDTSHVTAHVSISQDTQFLSFQLCSGSTVIEITNPVHQHTEYQFGDSVRVLSRRIHHAYLMGSSRIQVHVIIPRTGTNHDLQVLSGIQYLSVHLIATDNHGIGILNRIQQLRLLCIFLQKSQFHASAFHYLPDAFHSDSGERFLCSN